MTGLGLWGKQLQLYKGVKLYMEDVDLDIKRILFYSASSIWVELSNQCQAV